jgi:CRP-like cAMP-binding protein
VDDEARGTLVCLARDRRVVRRESFFEQGEPAQDVYVLCAGRLKMTQYEASGGQVILRLTGPGEAFGALDVEAGGAYPVCAAALEPSYALAWDRGAIDALAQRSVSLQRNLTRILCERARSLEQRVRDLTLERVPSRLARTLLRLSGQVGRSEPGGTVIGLSREELAQLSGTTLFTVSRLLCEWQTRGLVHARREAVIVTDAAGLGALALAEATPVERPSAAEGKFLGETLRPVNDGEENAR